MITKNYMQNLSNEINIIMNQLSDDIENVRNESKLKIINHDHQESTSDLLSIDYIPQNTVEALVFMELLSDECLLRDLDTMDKGMDELRETLRENLIKEKKSLILLDRLQYCKRDESITYLLLQLIPCILYLEARCGLKLFSILLEDGLSEYIYCVHPNIANENSKKERIKLFSNLVENAINTSILGDSRSPYQFNIPIEINQSTGKSQIGMISLENIKV